MYFMSFSLFMMKAEGLRATLSPILAIAAKVPSLGFFPGVCYVVVSLVLFPSSCILIIGVIWLLLVCPDLGVPKGFLTVVLNVPGGVEAFHRLFSSSVLGYQGFNEKVKGVVVKVRAFSEMRILLDVWLLWHIDVHGCGVGRGVLVTERSRDVIHRR
jgi:hypothetical protein